MADPPVPRSVAAKTPAQQQAPEQGTSPAEASKNGIVAFEEMDWKDALVFTAFPTTGAVASIAGHYLRDQLDLPLAGCYRVADQMPLIEVRDGLISSPIRIQGGRSRCDVKLSKNCRSIYLVSTDLPLQPPLLLDVAHAILDKAKEDGAHLVLALEGVVRDEDDDTPDVFLAGSSQEVLDELKAVDRPAAKRGMMVGMTAELLLSGRIEEVPVATLMVEANQKHPDGRAAAALLSALDPLLPDIHVETKPLEEQAMALEEEIKKAQKEAQAQARRTAPNQSSFI